MPTTGKRGRTQCERPPRSRLRGLVLAVAAVTALGPVFAQRGEIAPEAATGTAGKALALAGRHMVSAANPLAAEAGREILRKGGSAIDAAIATQLVLGLVEPQSSGLGGGAFVVGWDAEARKLETWDGREKAPAAARPDRFMRGGRPMPFDTAVHSGLSVGVPGLVRLLETVHRERGKLPWADVFAAAIRLAEEGFALSPRLNLLLRLQGVGNFAPAARRYFFDETGRPWPAGHVLRNPDYAQTLRKIAADGSDAFYTGAVAEAIVAAVKEAPNAAGDLTLDDLAAYTVAKREPLCFFYRKHNVCGMGPPSSGGMAVAQTLVLLEPFDLGAGPGAALDGRAMHLVAEAEKLAFADRDRYLADPAFVSIPAGLLDPSYLATRRALIDPAHATAVPPPAGSPPGSGRQSFGFDATRESVGTSHISVIDGQGNAVSMTTTIEGAFGSRLWAAGFLLNNELTDFSFVSEDALGRPVANRVEGGKRPRSSMAPTIVFDADGRVQAVLGSPGGSRIILYVIKALVALLDWKLDAEAAAALLNFGSRGGTFEIEAGWWAVWHALKLAALGQRVTSEIMTSGLHIIVVRDGRLEGGADPRREGAAMGD